MTNSRFVTNPPLKYVPGGSADLLDPLKYLQVLLAGGAGNLFYVDSATGDDDNGGTTPDDALATIDAAVGLCTANNGDVILVLPNHAENISTATSCVIDVAGVSIVGLGTGTDRPTLTWTATAGRLEVDADNIYISNLVLMSSISAVGVGVNVDGNNCIFEQVEWTFDATGDDFVLMADVDAVDRTQFINCIWVAEGAAGCTAALRLDDTEYTQIVGCKSYGIFGSGVISGVTGSAAASTNILLLKNELENALTSTGIVVDLHDSTTGRCSYNDLSSLDTSTAVASLFDPGNCRCFNNYVCNAPDESGALIPATPSG